MKTITVSDKAAEAIKEWLEEMIVDWPDESLWGRTLEALDATVQYNPKCQNCGSDNIDRYYFDGNGAGIVYRSVKCHNCGTLWCENFTFIGNTDMEIVPKLDRLQIGDLVHCKGHTYEIAEIESQHNYDNHGKDKQDCWYLEFRDSLGCVHYWKQDEDGGYVWRPNK